MDNGYSLKNIFETIIWIIMCHCLGDYSLQTEYLANNKGKNGYCMFVHCVTYCFPFVLRFGLSWKIFFIFFVHIICDTAKATYNLISILTDQIIHYIASMILIYKNWEDYGIFNLIKKKKIGFLYEDKK